MNNDTNDNSLIARLTAPLFRRKSVSFNDVLYNRVHNIPIKYAVTVNPAPTRLLNRKQYRLYDSDKQIAILRRIENALRRDNPAIKLIKLNFEKCPSNGQMHFHALFEMPALFVETMENYYNRILSSTDSKTRVPWRHFDIQTVYNEQGWVDYITKDAH